MNNLTLIQPEIFLIAGAFFILMFDVFFGKKIKNSFAISHFLALSFAGLALALIVKNSAQSGLLFNEMFFANPFTSITKAFTVLLLTFSIIISLNFVYRNQKISSEYLALFLISTAGAMLLISANDFLTFYLALEMQSLPLYLLASIKRDSKKSSEAGMKYFILGCLASGVLLFGISLIYGFSGTTNFNALAQITQGGSQSQVAVGAMLGFILVIIAMFFKIAAAPFHMWSPDVYEGSTVSVTNYFATVAKFSTIMVLLKLFYAVILGWNGIEKVFIFTAFLSLAVGSLGAIWQKNLKRLLAYSSISHVGFILLAVSAFHKNAFLAVVFYAIIYSIISVGSFAFLNLLQPKDDSAESDENNDKIFDISALSGLAKTNPVMAFSLATLIFSTAGIPPLAGFFSKFYVLTAFAARGNFALAAAAIIFSVIAAFYYLRVIKVMYFDEPKNIAKLDNLLAVKIIVFLMAVLNLVAIFFLDSIFSTISNFI